MTKPIIRIYTSSDTFIDREMNDEEYAQHLKDVSEFETRQAEAKAQAAAEETAKQQAFNDAVAAAVAAILAAQTPATTAEPTVEE